ncbi:MAG: glycosyltransferase [Proteobacteria bacterium]|nr:glycosyltransferase [Pseudomonadota bacterium]
MGAPETAVAAFARSIALAPDDIVAHGNRLFTLSFMTGTDDAQLFKEARAWARTVEKRWAPMPLRCPSRRAKRLRIGYHSYEYFRRSLLDDYFPPLLRHHDRDRFEIVLMADGGRRDARTDELRAMADGWVELAGLDLAGKVGRMRAADLDIAVCLTGYLAIQRVVFAPRVAPIQVAHMNHVATTGLAVFDYRITDRWLDPPGETEAWNVERLVRLENGYVPVTAPEPAPALSPPPALANGYVTFGSFNNLAKVTQATLQLWGRVLAAVKRSRLLLKARVLDDPGVRAVYAMRCGEAGIPPDRIDFVGEVAAHGEHLAAIAAADIGLDPTPFSGGHTTVEALWMGVPVINLRSNSVVGRLGASLLCRAQLDAFLATSAEEYVETAAALARDLARLGALRRTMRSKLLASPLFDASAYTQQLEHAYEAMVRERR